MEAIDRARLGALLAEAERRPRRRLHLNFHQSYSDPCQRFLNAMERDSYIRPHRHQTDPRDETIFAVAGKFAAMAFDETGRTISTVLFGSEAHWGADCQAAGVAVPACEWHTVVALATPAILLEMKAGPFNPAAAKEFADWAPEEGSPAAIGYLADLQAAVERVLAPGRLESLRPRAATV